MASNFKVSRLRKKYFISIWQTFTDTEIKKQGQAVFLTIEGKAREFVPELDVTDINCDSGIQNIINRLNEQYLKDKTQTVFETFETFEKYTRASEMTLLDFLNEFKKLLNKTKQYGTNISSDISYQLLKAAHFSEYHEQLTRTTISNLDFDVMKRQLKKIFGDSPSSSINLENPSFASPSGIKF